MIYLKLHALFCHISLDSVFEGLNDDGDDDDNDDDDYDDDNDNNN